MKFEHFHGPERSCVATSSGGTEIVFLAMLSFRVEARKRGISKPNIVPPFTAHAAFDKTSFYLGIELSKVRKVKTLFTAAYNVREAK